MIKEMVTEEFLAELSSKKPTPGGGGAAALGGAAGVSLGQMVINLTLGKKKYADVEEEMKELLEQLETLKAEFLHLADEDARVFAPLAAAYGLPGTTDEEKKRKAEVLEGHLLTASLVPLHAGRFACNPQGKMRKIKQKQNEYRALGEPSFKASFLLAGRQRFSLPCSLERSCIFGNKVI